MKKLVRMIIMLLSVVTFLQAQEDGSIQIDCDNVVHFLVIDSIGRKTGCDPRGKIDNLPLVFLHEIPNSNYSFEGVGDSRPDVKGDLYHEFHINLPEEIGPENFTILFFGMQTTKYTIDIFISRGTGNTFFHKKIDATGVIEKDSVNTYRFTYNSQPGSPITFIKVVNSHSLIQDISAMSKLGWIQSQTATQDYIQLFNTVGLQVSANNISGARTTLTSILNQLHADSAIAISGDACKLLSADVRQLLNELPIPTVLSVHQLLDSLSVSLQRFFIQGTIGNKQFMQELDRNIQNAKKEYNRKDSISCAEELEEFYTQIRKEYLAKPKKHDKQFVDEIAYQVLYQLAKEIESRVLTLPPQTAGTLLNQITVLRAQIRLDANKGWLGGVVLINGLETIFDKAKNQLQKKDSTGAALHIMLFRQTVRQTYEMSKKHSFFKTYVKPEGYISLYYQAGYILEKLPEPFGQSMPKMDTGLDKELQELKDKVVE